MNNNKTKNATLNAYDADPSKAARPITIMYFRSQSRMRYVIHHLNM